LAARIRGNMSNVQIKLPTDAESVGTSYLGWYVSSQGLASALNLLESDESRQWEGGPLKLPGATEKQLLETLNTTGSWSAMLWETSAGIGHLIIVDGLDDLGYVLIRDPWEGTKYKMTQDNFCQYWTTEAIFARKR